MIMIIPGAAFSPPNSQGSPRTQPKQLHRILPRVFRIQHIIVYYLILHCVYIYIQRERENYTYYHVILQQIALYDVILLTASRRVQHRRGRRRSVALSHRQLSWGNVWQLRQTVWQLWQNICFGFSKMCVFEEHVATCMVNIAFYKNKQSFLFLTPSGSQGGR